MKLKICFEVFEYFELFSEKDSAKKVQNISINFFLKVKFLQLLKLNRISEQDLSDLNLLSFQIFNF